MHWIIQSNIFDEQGHQVIVDVLEKLQIPRSIHKVVPFVGELIPEPEVIDSNVICIGAYSMRHYAKKKGWTPGVFDLEPYSFQIQKEHWGEEMLNYDSVVCKFKDANLEKPSFIRPVLDSKSFSGKVFDVDEFYDWKRKICVLKHEDGSTVDENTEIQLCSLKKIYSEYRFWVVDGKIVTSSLYKQGHRVTYSSEVPEIFHEYVNKMIAIWQPLPAFVIDVCDTSEGLKIVEINTLNSSGFYAGDMQKLVFALEDYCNGAL